ncbi:HD domain-containing protein [Candidatus Woesearchaeota archaeon]|nr:HD domain-containing protein [Candidatus Woesearchaeota archaeon]
MDPYTLLDKYLKKGSPMYNIIVPHSEHVAEKALLIADRIPELKPDKKFLKEICLLHDIGICKVKSDIFHATGKHKYVEHGFLGAEILREEGYPKHAQAVERHIGVGITEEQIRREKLPIPVRDMVPETIEEEILAFADNFFSKTDGLLPLDVIKSKLARFGEEKPDKFNEWCKRFKEPVDSS